MQFSFDYGSSSGAARHRTQTSEWILFDLATAGKRVYLKWSTVSAYHSFFTVQRSADGLYFDNVGTLTAGDGEHHEFVDENPLACGAFYRLKETSLNGHESLSMIRYVSHFSGGLDVQLFPYPNKGYSFSLQASNANCEETALVVVFDAEGREVAAMQESLQKADFQKLHFILPRRLTPGVYEVVTSFTTHIFHNKFLVIE